MSLKARIYIQLVVCAALVAFSRSAMQSSIEDPARFVLLAALTGLAATLKFSIPGMTGTFSAASLMLLAGIAQLTAVEAALLGAIAGFVQSTMRTTRRPVAAQVVFNTAAMLLSTVVTFTISHAAVAPVTFPNAAAMLALAGAIYFLLNTFLVAGVISLVEGEGVFSVWRKWHVSSLPYYLGCAGGAAVLTCCASGSSWRVALYVLPLAVMAHVWWMLSRTDLRSKGLTPVAAPSSNR